MSDDPRPKRGRALAAEQARIGRFCQTIHKHRRALDLAIEQDFDGELDAAEWRPDLDADIDAVLRQRDIRDILVA